MYVKQLPKLKYKQGDSLVPMFSGESNLQTVIAEPWLKISDEGLALEGLCFDRQGNLYFVDAFGGNVYQVTLPEKKIKIIYRLPELNPAAVKIHKDGRLFVCGVGDFKSTGRILAMQQDGSEVEVIVPSSTGYCIDDLVFDQKGGFYFTDLKGFPTNPIGGVYYVSPDFTTIQPVLQNMAAANGIALSTDEKTLWATELNANRLHRVLLQDDGIQIAPFGANIPYTFTGHHGPDSCCIDSDDNLYVAMYEQGRALVFSKTGYPIGQILLPGRDTGHMLRSTHPAFIPGTDQLLICSNDGTNGRGAWIYIARGFATGHLGYQFSE
ncbi:SMP-30/gluconolactonase/LRE family protein [Metabacillus arenae]|uniref:SMP-30/gluconolactonase/LRE family protein n=1 Tax=Metabacillus arenae TaxID=2771434 RepID=A0A926S1H0_9BACI|nr:SMP-30/gluconolactonase/LRE family protein [Metabacillus arenae]MBD1381004.1 SMP-30/gluconolactonase/LRE family protein [Metabacillus arenae]